MFSKRVTLGFMKPLSIHFCPIHGTKRVGDRDVVGHGRNGIACYNDDAHFPFPSVRFMENSPQILELRKKEEGDWKSLTVDEKKALYRASFCQTFAEFQHPTGHWKFVLGGTLILTSFGFWLIMFQDQYVRPPSPASLSPSHLRAQLRRMLDLHVNPIDGLASQWDYDNDCWKSESKIVALRTHDQTSVPPPPPDAETVVPPCDNEPHPMPCGCGCKAGTPLYKCDE